MPPFGIALVSFLVATVIVAPIGVYEYRTTKSDESPRVRSNIPNGLPIPVHIPMSVFTTPSTYDVPYWLGGFAVTTPSPSIWTLPLTYQNGGKVQPGEFLQIRNYGPSTITLQTTAPETIESTSNYVILPGITMQVLSSANWIATTLLNSGNSPNTSSLIVPGYIAVGMNNATYLASLMPGDINANRIYLGKNKAFIDTIAQRQSVGTLFAADTRNASFSFPEYGSFIYNELLMTGVPNPARGLTNQFVLTNPSTTPFTNGAGRLISSELTLYGPVSYSSMYGFFSITSLGANYTGTITSLTGFSDGGIIANSGSSLTITSQFGFFTQPSSQLATTVVDYAGFYCGFTSRVTGKNACYRAPRMLGATNNAAIWMESDVADCGSGIVAGSAFDTCLYRAAAGVWTFNAGSSLRVPGYTSVGSSTAPTNVASGAISTTRSSPALQAFGAVTANAASGILAFTVTTAAVSCSTAVITNTNVATTSEVILTIQSYSGVDFTNGIPAVSRADTAGSSSGSFTIKLCNLHATNALSGNLYVAFWVLN